MARRISIAMMRAINSPRTGEVIATLLRIYHNSLTDPIRVTNDNQQIVSRGQTYLAFPFMLAVGSDNDESPPRPTLRISNVDRQIVQALRRATQNIEIEVELVLASQPDVVEDGPYRFILRDASYDAMFVEGTLVLDDLMNEGFPGDQIGPALFPGVFTSQA